MKIVNTLLVLLAPCLIHLIGSCCSCLDPVIERYTNKSLELAVLDNAGPEPVVSADNRIPIKAFGLRLGLNREKTACLFEPQQGWGVTPALYATSCDCSLAIEYQPKDSVETIKITTLSDFDATHPAGSDISGYFKAYKSGYFSEISSYIDQYFTVLYGEADFREEVDLLLLTPPAISGQYQFVVRLLLSDGRILEQRTPEITLL